MRKTKRKQPPAFLDKPDEHCLWPCGFKAATKLLFILFCMKYNDWLVHEFVGKLCLLRSRDLQHN